MSRTVFSKTEEIPIFLDSLPTSRRLALAAIRHFSVEEYHRIVEAGILDEDERVELIGGRILEMSPIGSQHAAYVSFLNRKLRVIEETAIVRIQGPIILDDETEPQPDIAVVRFRANAYADSHPRSEDVLLLIEVADTSLGSPSARKSDLEEDRLIKLPRYADSGIPEVWIFDLIESIVEVYREPLTLANGIPGYRRRTDFRAGEFLIPESFPDLKIEIPEPDGLLK
jgi:Uma2 family endonuclease